ncbi:MAG TPA: hypothetical protein VFG67_10550 [Oleiagrimonas sp.]|nr:hypothetical protein [Oleiagrimonas sp.]
MSLKIAVQPDEVIHTNGERQSFSKRWIQLAQGYGIEVVPVDVYARDAIAQIATCDAFMWRCTGSAHQRLYAKRLLYAVAEGLDMAIYPSLVDAWYFEDKIAQHGFFNAAGIPTPQTEIFWSRQHATRFCDTATYPFVLKLAGGIQASNVCLVHNRNEAMFYIEQLFGSGTVSLGYRPASRSRQWLRRLRNTTEVIRGRNPGSPTTDAELQHGYFYVQEFIPGNNCNIRVTIIGSRAFVFRMFNRPDDFRASLIDGNMDWNPDKVGEDAIHLAWRAARQLGTQAVAADIIYRDSQPVLVELTLNFASWAVRDCPGHWALEGEPDAGKMTWTEGHVEPADAIFEDFVPCIRQRHDEPESDAIVTPSG